MMNFFGLLGLCCIAAAWIPQTLKTLQEKRCDIRTSFLVLYIIGSVSLTVYSILNFDLVFLLLNLLATLQSIMNFYYRLFPKLNP